MKLAYVAVLLAACSRPPDFKAYCERVAPCEHTTVDDCIAKHRDLWREQKERGCADEGTEIVACKIKYGRCETAGTWSLFMPGDECLPQVHALGDCLAKNR